MRSLSNKRIIEMLLLFSTISIFGVLYWGIVISPPLFGDATIHGANAKDILNGGWRAIRAEYPSFYSYLMVVLYEFFGEKGFNLVPYIGFLFLLISSFLFIRQITKNFYVSLISVVIIGSSPKLIYYSARMYQEILISALFIFCFFLLFKYLEKKNKNYLLLHLFFVGITLSIKQQGIFVLYSSLLLFFFILFLKKRIKLIDLSLIVAIPILIGLPFYGILFHSIGSIQPGSEEFGVFRLVNTVGRKIFSYCEKCSTPLYSANLNNHNYTPSAPENDDLQQKLEQVEKRYNLNAFSRAEKRHIWPTDVFTNFIKFNQAHNLYVDLQGVPLETPLLLYLFFFSMLLGILYCAFKYKLYKDLLIFSLIFLPINYILFSRNSDQQRYHLFLPIFMFIFTSIILNFFWSQISINKYLKIYTPILVIILFLTPILSARLILNSRWGNSQIYTSSIGGIDSIKDASYWLKRRTSSKSFIGQQCGNELHYYSQRNVLGDWRIYYLDSPDLKNYFYRSNIAYYVIYKSQVVEDDKWVTTCWIPESFFQRMNLNYKLAYETNAKDIYVYEIK